MDLSPIGYSAQSTIVHGLIATIGDMGTIGERMAAAAQEIWGDKWRVELVKATGISRQTLHKIEVGGTKNPQPETLFEIADALGVEARWLGTGKGPRTPISRLSRDQQRWLDIQAVLSDEQQVSLSRFLAPMVCQQTENGSDNGR